MSQNGYAKQHQLWQEGPVGDCMVIMYEIYICSNDYDQVMFIPSNTDNNTPFLRCF